jgi:hypothetical protein
VQRIILDTEAGTISAELSRRGVAAGTWVRVGVEVLETSLPPMAAIAQAGKAFDWLANEDELYADSDLVKPAR